MKTENFLKKLIDYTEKNGQYAFKKQLMEHLKLNEGEFNRLYWANDGCFFYDLVHNEPRIKIFTPRCQENLKNFSSENRILTLILAFFPVVVVDIVKNPQPIINLLIRLFDLFCSFSLLSHKIVKEFK